MGGAGLGADLRTAGLAVTGGGEAAVTLSAAGLNTFVKGFADLLLGTVRALRY